MQCMCGAIDLSSVRNGLPSESSTFSKLNPRVKWQVCEELNVPMFIQPLTGNTAPHLWPNCDSSGSSRIKLHISLLVWTARSKAHEHSRDTGHGESQLQSPDFKASTWLSHLSTCCPDTEATLVSARRTDSKANRTETQPAERGSEIIRTIDGAVYPRSLFLSVFVAVRWMEKIKLQRSSPPARFLGALAAAFGQDCVNNLRRWTPSTSQPTACFWALPTTHTHSKHMERQTCTLARSYCSVACFQYCLEKYNILVQSCT